MQVEELTAFLEGETERQLARFLEYVLTGWAIRTGKRGQWSVIAYVMGDK